MFGAICGDIIGSYYELHCTKKYDFDLFCKESTFTDDTVLTIATCDAIINNPSSVSNLIQKNKRAQEYAYKYKQYYRYYPDRGYGQMFTKWAKDISLYKQYSYANGGAIRVIPISYAYDNIDQVLLQSRLNCKYTHNHKAAITAAQAVAAASFKAYRNNSKYEIKEYIETTFGYDLSAKIDQLRETFVFDSNSSYSVPPAIIAFLESSDYEDAIRKAISLGGDSDTMACIAGGIAEAYYKNIPKDIKRKCYSLLDANIKGKIREFYSTFIKDLSWE